MTRTIATAMRTPIGELCSLLAVGVGLAGLLGAAQAVGELRYILACAGAIGARR